MENILDLIFSRLFFLMKLGMIYFVLVLCGGIILGFSPAATAILSLYHEHKTDISQYHFKDAWSYYKKNFRQSNAIFLACFSIIALLIYGIFLLVQLPQNYFLLALTVLNCIFVVYLGLVYVLYLKLQVYYELHFKNALKLSAIAVFFDFFSLVKIILGTAICFYLVWQVSQLIALFLPILWLIFIFDVLEPNYRQVEAKMVSQ